MRIAIYKPRKLYRMPPKPASDSSRFETLIHDVPDFPKPGVVFKDITPLLADAAAFAEAIGQLAERVRVHRPTGIVATEARGFLLGAPLALAMRLPLIPVRKPGKLPRRTINASYQLEYGTDRVEMHADAIVAGGRYAIVDDVIATGGTAAATAEMVEVLGGHVACFAFLIELEFLNGRQRLGGRALEALLRY
jgi:adenine phosphoribosyltransferase